MLRLRQVELGILEDESELINRCSKKLKTEKEKIKDLVIVKKSIDARDKNDIKFSYEVDVKVENEIQILKKIKSKDIFITPNEEYKFIKTGTEKLKYRPIIVGAGPAGLFCAYMLAKNGYNPLIIERGESVEERIKTVEKFWNTGILNKNSNVQFGEGGAGTFSDGKLNTMVKDKFFRNKEVLKIFVESGAPKEILYENKPHIGTDLLRDVVINLRKKIIQMGGEIKYNSCMTDINIENGKLKEIEINGKEKIVTEILVLAIGHSARDTFRMLESKNINMEPKPFAVGVRVQHSQNAINEAQYGKYKENLEPAPYKLTFHSSNGRGVYSFCMCPGGYVVNSSSEERRLVINGMSNYKRDTKNANSAIVVTVSPLDFEEKLFGGMEFQEELERKAFELGCGKIPIQLLGDFLENKKSKKINAIEPVIKGDYILSNLKEILPKFIADSLQESFEYFDKKIRGFANKDAILAGIETRTSSPIRIVRNENGHSNICGIYPTGEGAGYAGGIMSAAMDGIKIAENIAKIYAK